MLRRFSLNQSFFFRPRFLFPASRFGLTDISDFAQRAFYEETKKLEEEAVFRDLMENLQRSYQLEQKAQNARTYLQDNFRKLSINSKSPLKDILENYRAKNRYGFDEDILVLTLDYLARTHKSLGSWRISEDLKIDDLHVNSRFCDLIEEIKYGLKEGVVFDFSKISKAFSSLVSLEYKDLDLQTLCFEKILRTLKGTKEEFKLDITNPFNNYQSFKKHYYQNFIDVNSILENKEFMNKVNAFLQLQEDEPVEDTPNTQSGFHQTHDIIIALIENLNSMISQNESNFNKIIQGIMSLRSQYRKIKKNKNINESIKANANVHVLFYDLEEKLLNLGIISLEDIKKPNDFEPTESEELSNVTKIFEEFIKEYYPETINLFNILPDDTNKQATSPKSDSPKKPKIQVEDYIKKEGELKMTEISEILVSLSEISRLPVKEVKNRDYIAEKWKRLFEKPMPQEIKNLMSEYHDEPRDYNCDKLLSPIYLVSLKYFNAIYPEIQKVVSQKSPLRDLIHLTHAYANMGLDEKSNHFLNLISNENATQLSSFSHAEFKAFLHSSLSAFNLNPCLSKPLQAYVSSRFQEFDLESFSLAFLALAQYELNPLVEDEFKLDFFPKLFDHLKFCLAGEQDLHRFSVPVANYVYDMRILLNSNSKLGLLPQKIVDSAIPNIDKYFAGFEKMDSIVGDNYPEKNPILVDFLKLLKKNSQNENLLLELQELEFRRLNRNYQPHLLTRKQEKNNTSIRNAIFFLDSNHNPLEGNNLKEIWRLRFAFLEKTLGNLRCRWVPSNTLYQIDEAKQDIILKSPEELTSLCEKIINRENGIDYLGTLRQFSDLVSSLYLEKKEEFKNFKNNASILKLHANFSEIFRIGQKINFTTFELLSAHYFEQIKLLLFESSQATRALKKSIQKELLKVFNEKFSQNCTSIKNMFRFLIKSISENAPVPDISKMTTLKEEGWIGRRLGNELIDSQGIKNINYEIMDLGFYNDHSYHHYSKWKQLYSQITDNNLLFVSPRKFSNLLFSSNPEGKVSDVVGAIPDSSHLRNIIKPLSYKFNWEREFYQLAPKVLKEEDKHWNLAAQCQTKLNKELEFIVNLQNFKYVLKKNMSVDQIAQMLLDFKFVDELIEEHLKMKCNFEKSSVKFKRRGKDLLKYLNHPYKRTFTNDYTRYMLKIALRKDRLKQMLKMRNSLKIYKEYKEGKIDLKTLQNFRTKIDRNIRKQIKEMEAQSNENPTGGNQSNKYLDYEYDTSEILRNIGRNQSNKEYEMDFIKSNGSYKQYLLREKRKAESKLIRARIMKKIHEQLPLTTNENLYVKAWVNNKLPHNPLKATKRSIGSLVPSDKEILSKVACVNFQPLAEFPLNDLILEFSLFFDDKFVKEVEWRLRSKFLHEKWGINTKLLLPCCQNNENNYLLHFYENHLFNIAGEFTQDEKGLIVEIMRILRDKTKIQKEKFVEFEKSIGEFVQLVNPFKNRFALMKQWLSQKEEELKHNCYSSISYGNQEKELKEVWEKIFTKKYEETTSQDLHLFLQSFVERFYILKKYLPHSFNNIVKYTFQHPQLNNVDREILITFLEVFDLEVKLDCKEIEDYLRKAQPQKDHHLFNEEIFMNRLKNASIPFMDSLIEKTLQA